MNLYEPLNNLPILSDREKFLICRRIVHRLRCDFISIKISYHRTEDSGKIGDSDNDIETIDEIELNKTQKTKIIAVDPDIISEFSDFASSNPDIEVAGLLAGNMQGEFLVVYEIHNCLKSKSTPASVEIDAEEMCEISRKLCKGNYLIGWAHSHVGCGVFFSGMDIKVQKDFQNLFSDSVGLVIDPFKDGKAEYKFFRLVDGEVREMKYKFLVRNKYGA